MRRALFLMIQVLVLVMLFVWILRHPGQMNINWLGYEVEMAFSHFIIGTVVIVAVIWLTLSFLVWVLRFPFRLGDRYVKYNRQKGFESLYEALEALSLGDMERFEKKTEHVELLLKERELSLYLKAEGAIAQKNYHLSEQYFYELSLTKRGHRTGLMGLLRSGLALKHKDQVWRIAQKLVEIAPASVFLQKTYFEAALEHRNFELALDAAKLLRKTNLMEEEPVRHLMVQAFLAREADLRHEEDEEGAYNAARDAFTLVKNSHTLTVLLPYLKAREKKRRARRYLLDVLSREYDDALFKESLKYEGRSTPVETYEFLKQLYPNFKTQPEGTHLVVIKAALEASLWGEADALLKAYEAQYGQTQRFYSLRAELALLEQNNPQKAIEFYQKACENAG